MKLKSALLASAVALGLGGVSKADSQICVSFHSFPCPIYGPPYMIVSGRPFFYGPHIYCVPSALYPAFPRFSNVSPFFIGDSPVDKVSSSPMITAPLKVYEESRFQWRR